MAPADFMFDVNRLITNATELPYRKYNVLNRYAWKMSTRFGAVNINTQCYLISVVQSLAHINEVVMSLDVDDPGSCQQSRSPAVPPHAELLLALKATIAHFRGADLRHMAFQEFYNCLLDHPNLTEGILQRNHQEDPDEALKQIFSILSIVDNKVLCYTILRCYFNLRI